MELYAVEIRHGNNWHLESVHIAEVKAASHIKFLLPTASEANVRMVVLEVGEQDVLSVEEMKKFFWWETCGTEGEDEEDD